MPDDTVLTAFLNSFPCNSFPQSRHGFLQFLTVWLPGHVGSAHFTHIGRFLAFFVGRRSAKESATRFRASFSMVSRVVIICDLSEIGFEFEGWFCWELEVTDDEAEGSSELVALF